MGDRDESPSLPGSSATTGRMRKGRKVRSPPAGDEEKLRLRIGPAGRGAGRASFSFAKRGVPRDAGDAKGVWSKKGRGRKWNPSSDWDLRPEATPELVSQDRGAGDLRVAKADEHRRILRSAQMGAGSNAGPHFACAVLRFSYLGLCSCCLSFAYRARSPAVGRNASLGRSQKRADRTRPIARSCGRGGGARRGRQ